MDLQDILYSVILLLIKATKWCELQVLKLAHPLVLKFLISRHEKLGIVYHQVSHLDDNSWRSRWTKEDETKALAKSQYETLCHLKVVNKSFLVNAANRFSHSAGESYRNGDWSGVSENDLVTYVERILSSKELQLYLNVPWNRLFNYLEFSAFNIQSRRRATAVIEAHYDLGNDFMKTFLGSHMQYSCAYWATATDLNQAQIDKLELIARKLELQPGMRVLDLGCGWGTLAKHLAENYGVEIVGVTLSKEGATYARQICQGLPVDIRVQDYRDIKDKFDRIVSIELMEHVGFKNHRTFFNLIHKCLKDDGLALIHTIGVNDYLPRTDPYLHAYIFPNIAMSYQSDVVAAIRNFFMIEDWHSFGADFGRTFTAWLDNFKMNWPTIEEKYGSTFYRTWTFALLTGRAGFQSRQYQVWQIVLSKYGTRREYRSVR